MLSTIHRLGVNPIFDARLLATVDVLSLKEHIGSLVGWSQTGFIPARWMWTTLQTFYVGTTSIRRPGASYLGLPRHFGQTQSLRPGASYMERQGPTEQAADVREGQKAYEALVHEKVPLAFLVQ